MAFLYLAQHRVCSYSGPIATSVDEAWTPAPEVNADIRLEFEAPFYAYPHRVTTCPRHTVAACYSVRSLNSCFHLLVRRCTRTGTRSSRRALTTANRY